MHAAMKSLLAVGILLSLTSACAIAPMSDSVPANEGGQILLADSDGRLLLLNVVDGQKKVLSQPGVYRPGDSIGPVHLWAPIRLSPDGQWLAIPSFDSQSTWLIGLDGSTQVKMYSSAVNLVWSPDSRQIAFHNPNASPETLYLQNVTGKEIRPLARLPGKILMLAWSPISPSIAVAYSLDPIQAHIVLRPWEGLIEIALVNVQSGEIERLAQVPTASTEAAAWDLAWSPDGHEIWYLKGALSLSAEGKSLRPLATEPWPEWLIREAGKANVALSPDGLRVAWAAPGDTPGGASVWVADIREPEGRAVIAEGLGPVSQLSWTQDGQMIIAAGPQNTLTAVWCITVTTGQVNRLVDNVYLVGTVWDLQRHSSNIGVTAGHQSLPAPDATVQWPAYTAAGLGLGFEYPPGWKTWDSPQMVTLSNVAFERLGGWVSLGEENLLLTFNKVYVPSRDEWLNENVRSIGGELRDVLIAGRTSLCWRRSMQAIQEECFVPLDNNATLVIRKYPANSLYDNVFERVIASLQFEPGLFDQESHLRKADSILSELESRTGD